MASSKWSSFATRSQPGQVGRFIRVVFWFFLAVELFRLALFAVQLSEPFWKAGLVALVIAILATINACRHLWIWLIKLAPVQALAFLAIVYVIAVLVTAMTSTDSAGFGPAVFRSAARVPQTFAAYIGQAANQVFRYPLAFTSGYNSHNRQLFLDAVQANEPNSAVIHFPPVTSRPAGLSSGSTVSLISTAKQSCQLDTMSDNGFYAAQAVYITEGPRLGKSVLWWRVRSDAGSAWCPESALTGP